MPSTFFGLNITTTGIRTAQAAINTASHNMANAKTTGYSRQVVSQQAAAALSVYSKAGMLGAGAEVTSIDQVRDAYYDVRYRNNSALLGEQSVKYNYLMQVEDLFSEEKVDGFTKEYEKFFGSIDDLVNDSSSKVIRNEVVNYASSLADYLNGIQTGLKKMQAELNTEISNKADQINTLSDQIASLTKQINSIELTGVTANDLRDKRGVLLDNLSAIVPIDVKEVTKDNGKTDFSVKTSGYTLVDGNSANHLTVVTRTNKVNETDADGLYDIYIDYNEQTGSGTKLNLRSGEASGELKALFDLRDGNNGEISTGDPASKAVDFKGVPYYMDTLNDFIGTFAKSFNELHSTGYNLYGDKTTDLDFFIIQSDGKLTVNQDIVKDVSLIAASLNPIQDGNGDGGLAEQLHKLKDANIYEGVTSKEYLQSIVSEIAIDTGKSKTFNTYYTNIKATITNQRLSVSGVDTDEESMNLVKYQESYNLSARMMQVMSELYDKLINETGV